ncbi:hypothetical protein MNBD_GAMMA23-571 [hydrothermal vent metagenome]|uniref:Uncharacterized protein n=2 Tax=hydrothermal vent metagenome TaxID=652676 RepID=A0A3B0ZVP9_9ZZZZ
MEQYFIILLFIMAAYVGMGNYVYFKKVLPQLKNENKNIVGSYSPSVQQVHMQQYVGILEGNNERPWFYYFLKYNNFIVSIIFALVILFAITMYKQL